ncbi:hypothetical protein [Mucilaginibacter aquaedulcis]|jgi:hypothetical protein|uniref:hypothetical protein n=1 Tax=Mucilaginibacter aquaedulcis TaxID=1187081 RepID=UPI0025B3CD0C|nr:hypothetical protein [Mucilaginibacter aquaedulcis]MDN3547487.1 hypothetical protein [Mucilaginibacter aquaedulcis]
MKRNLLYLLPLLLMMLGAACSPKSDNTPIPAPLGTYKGTFKLLVKKGTTTAYDTVKKDSLLNIKIANPNTYAVTGDTATVHAGSKGLFQYDGYNSLIAFYDSTYKAGPQPKFHLVGTYRYAYNGTRLQFTRANALQDSILFYDLYKTSN